MLDLKVTIFQESWIFDCVKDTSIIYSLKVCLCLQLTIFMMHAVIFISLWYFVSLKLQIALKVKANVLVI